MKNGLFCLLVLCLVALSAARPAGKYAVTSYGPPVAVQGNGEGSLTVTGIPEFQVISKEAESLDLVICIDAPEVPPSGRAPASITEVLDRSGSMSGTKLENLKSSAITSASLLEADDYAGIVSFSTDVTTDLTLTTSPVPDFQTLFENAIDPLVASGGTNLAGGLFAGIDQQTEANIPGKVPKGVLVFTDGMANTGITDISTITSMMATELSVANPPRVHTLGFGGDHDAAFLQAIAAAGGGSYFFVEDEADIPSVFGFVVGGLLSVAAQDIVVDLMPLNGATITSVVGGTVNADNTQVTFSDIWAGESKKILISMDIPAIDYKLKVQKILKVTVTYCNMFTQETETTTLTIAVWRFPGATPKNPAPEVEQTRLRFQTADDLEDAAALVEAGNIEGASAILDATLATLAASPQASSPEVQDLIADVERLQEDVESGDSPQEIANRLIVASTNLRTGRASGADLQSVQPTSRQSEVAAGAVAAASGK